ncbi:MAG: 4-diphosphocytidyl-2-C-methyl-D-erythritol kinase [Pedosphaera sp.]|nr:4-diphosphocytidyl-2-C-methyl-D-erythritol kinase [Pedosphaera sp.]
MTLEKQSPCKVNLLLNILGKRPDGFHELETVMHPVNLADDLTFSCVGQGVEMTCSDASLPTDSRNLVHRAATAFLETAGISEGVRIHLEKKIPQAAGLGGGSGDAAVTLLGLNEVFGQPLSGEQLQVIAARLGSDIPFFLQNKPALATGRGEKITPLDFFPAMRGSAFVLIHPGFGIATAWAYQTLAQFPQALNGQPGRAERLIKLLQTVDLTQVGSEFYNSLEAPALEKYPLLAIFQEFLRANGAAATLMSGSGSTTFALAASQTAAEQLVEKFKQKFGANCWTAVVPV